MKKKLKTLVFMLLLPGFSVFAQPDTGWKPIGLTINGRNMQQGVEAFYQLTKCNNENVVFIKLVNHNSYKVISEWNDAVFSKQLTWHSNKKEDKRKSVVIDGNSMVLGDCSGKSLKELMVRVGDFIDNIDNFTLFKAESFIVTENKKK